MIHSMRLTEGLIRVRLAEPDEDPDPAGLDEPIFDEPATPAAVLIPLLHPDQASEGWHILFTRRTELVADHKGQVSFPGGRSDPGDISLEETALREAQEEIGLNPVDVRILGKLRSLYTVSNYRITPVVGVIPWPYSFRLQHHEVSRVFTIPLEWLVDSAHYQVSSREAPFPGFPPGRQLRLIHYHLYDGELLWGVSAEITLRLLHKLGY